MKKKRRRSRHYVWWKDGATAASLLAGTALYDGSSGEYEIRLDFFPDHAYRLRPIGTREGAIEYRMETLPKGRGTVSGTGRSVGIGIFRPKKENKIFITAGPFCKRLVLVV